MKKKESKIQWVTIDAIPNSIIVTPEEIKEFKNHGIDLLKLLKKIQKEIYPKKKR